MIKSIFVEKKQVTYANIKPTKEGFLLKGYGSKELNDDFKNLDNLINEKDKNFISYSFINIENIKVEVPSVQDEKTKFFLIRNQVKNQGIEVNNFKLYYTFDRTEGENDIYTVYLLPYSVFEELNISKEKKVLLDLFTFSVFSLSSLSGEFFKEKNILHIYSSERQIIITLSKNKHLFYFRIIDIPEYISTEEQFTNFLYESVNLTYIYIQQSINIEIETIIVSGEVPLNKEISELIYNFINIPIAVLIPCGFIENCDGQIFQKFIVNFGNLVVDKSLFDIRLEEYIYKKNFIKLSKILFFVSLFTFFISSFILASSYVSFVQKENEIEYLENLIKDKIKEKLAQTRFSYGEYKYYIKYLNLIKKANEGNAFLLLNKILPLLKIYPFNNISSKVNNNRFTIKITDNIKFTSLIEFNNFKGKINKVIMKLSNPELRITNRSTFDADSLSVKLNIIVTGNISR
ncbi:MAG TPA: hypothetical protein EYH43_04945 [Persephonella sp.]|nr:hypothetical protein [Hydrogenothermaceae bacterium]HIQ25311.1 hypothetical protein [Persephonella sp.]